MYFLYDPKDKRFYIRVEDKHCWFHRGYLFDKFDEKLRELPITIFISEDDAKNTANEIIEYSRVRQPFVEVLEILPIEKLKETIQMQMKGQVMYIIHNKTNKKFFSGISPTGRYMFEKFSIEDTSIRVAIFKSESDACITANEIIQCGTFCNSDASGIEVKPLSFIE